MRVRVRGFNACTLRVQRTHTFKGSRVQGFNTHAFMFKAPTDVC